MNTKYWYFNEHLEQGKISIDSVSNADQITNLLTKTLSEAVFDKLKIYFMGKDWCNTYTICNGVQEKMG